MGSRRRAVAPPVRVQAFGLARPVDGKTHPWPAPRAIVRPRGEGPTYSGFTPSSVGAMMGHAQARPPKGHLCRCATAGVRGVLVYCSDYPCSH